jgi:hypothetical protein
MTKRLTLALVATFLSGSAFAQTLPVVGPLQAQNKLSEIKQMGSDAQNTARLNLGISGVGSGTSDAQLTTLNITDTNKNRIVFTPFALTGTPPTAGQSTFTLDLSMTGGTGTYYNLYDNTIVRGAPNANIWGGVDVLNYVGTGGTGQHVARYAQTVRRAAPASGGNTNNPQLWPFVGEFIDMTGADSKTTNAQLSMELDMRGANVDNANNRQGLVQVLSTYGSGVVPMEASRGIGVVTSGNSQWKRLMELTGNYQTAAIDLRNAGDNGVSAGGTRPVITSTVSDVTVPVSNVMPFTSDRFGRDVNQGTGGSFNTPVTINGHTYTESGYAITGSGPAGTITLTTAVGADGTSGNTVRNGSHTFWMASGQDIALDTLGSNQIYYDAGVNSIGFKQGGVLWGYGNQANFNLNVPLGLNSYFSSSLPTATSANRGWEVWVTDCTNNGESVPSASGCIYTVNNQGNWVRATSGGGSGSLTIGGQVISLGGSTTNQGGGEKLQLSTGTVVNGHCAQFDATGNVVDAGAACGTGGTGGGGTVASSPANTLPYYASTGTTLSGTNTANNAVLVTNGSGVPSISATLPSGLAIPTPTISTPTLTGAVTSTGKLSTAASTATLAGLRLNPGAAPTSPADGDMWLVNSLGLQYRANGTTITPPSSIVASSPLVVSGTGAVTISCPTCNAGNQTGSAVIQWPSNTTVTNDTYYVSLAWPWASGTINAVKYATGGSRHAFVLCLGADQRIGCDGMQRRGGEFFHARHF